MIIVFGKEIPLYGICFFIGILVSVVIAYFLFKREKMEIFDFVCCAIYVLIGSIIGAKLLFVIVSIETIIEYNLSFIDIIKGGFVFYGGLFGGYLGAIIYGKQFKYNISNFITIAALVLPLGHAFGRIGCFFSGCCYGIEYHGIFSHTYYQSHNALTPLGVPLFPVQLLESALLFILFAVLMIIYAKKVHKHKMAEIYLFSYSIIRFALEFLRGDAVRGGFLGLSTSQWISLLIIGFLIVRKII